MLTHISCSILPSSQWTSKTVYTLPFLHLFEHLKIVTWHFIWVKLCSLHQTIWRWVSLKFRVKPWGELDPIILLLIKSLQNPLVTVDMTCWYGSKSGQLIVIVCSSVEWSLKRVIHFIHILGSISYSPDVRVQFIIGHTSLLLLLLVRTWSRSRWDVTVVSCSESTQYFKCGFLTKWI